MRKARYRCTVAFYGAGEDDIDYAEAVVHTGEKIVGFRRWWRDQHDQSTVVQGIIKYAELFNARITFLRDVQPSRICDGCGEPLHRTTGTWVH